MKLPMIEYRQVETLGRADTGAPSAMAAAQQQRGNVLQKAMGQLAEVTAQFIERKENAEYNNNMAETSIEVSEWEGQNGGRATFSAEDIEGLPDYIPRTETGTANNGDKVSVPRKAIPAYEVYPLLLEQKLRGVIKEKAEKISNPRLRQDYINKSEAVAAEKIMRATISAEQQQQAYMLADGKDKIKTAATRGDISTAFFLIDQLETSDLVKKQLKEEAEFDVEVFYVNSAIRSTDQEAILMMRQALDDPNYSGQLNEAQRQGSINALNTRFVQIDAERDADRKIQHSISYNTYKVGITDGQVTRLDLDNGYARWQADKNDPNGINPDEYSALVDRLRVHQNSIKTEVDYSAKIAGFMDGTAPANPENKDDRDAIDWYVNKVGLTRDNVVELGQLTQLTGIVPQPLQDIVNGFILNGNDEQAALGMQYFQNLRNGAPHLVSRFGSETEKVANLASLFMRGGQSAAEAISQSRQWHLDVTPEIEQTYRSMYKDLEIEPTEAMHDMMAGDPLWDQTLYPWDSRSVDAHPDMTAMFSQLTQKYYPLTKGNLEQAQAMAYQGIKKTWGISGAGSYIKGMGIETGKRPMKNPPERLLNASTEDIMLGMDGYAKKHGVDRDGLILVSDSDTPKIYSWQVLKFDDETATFELMPDRFTYGDVKGAAVGNWEEEVKAEMHTTQTKEALRKQAEEVGDESSGWFFDNGR